MRVVRRVAERLVDPGLELLGEDVLEPVGLGVHLVDGDPERLGEVELEQPVVADHLERHPLAVGGERRSPRYGAWSTSPSAASFFTIALVEAGETPIARARPVVVTRSAGAASS